MRSGTIATSRRATWTGTCGIDRGYLRAVTYFFAGRFLVTLEGGVGAIEHPTLFFGPGNGGTAGPTAPVMANAYTDVRADATLFAEYRVLPSIGINGTVSYLENFSNTQLARHPWQDITTHAHVYDDELPARSGALRCALVHVS